MFLRLLKRHREAVQYVERVLEGQLPPSGLPAAVVHMDDAEALNLAPLLAALAPAKDFARRLLDVRHAVRRARRCARAAALEPGRGDHPRRVQMQSLCDPEAPRYAAKIPDDAREDEAEHIRKETRAAAAEVGRQCWEQDALVRRRRAAEATRGRHDARSALVRRATLAHLGLLEALCASPAPGVAETARRRTCGRLGEALPSICMLATRQAAEGPEIQEARAAVLLLTAAQPAAQAALLRANVADLCRALLNVREPVEVRRAALDVLQAGALSCLTCVNLPRPASPAGSRASSRPGTRPPRARVGPAAVAGVGGADAPGTADADRPPSPQPGPEGEGGRRLPAARPRRGRGGRRPARKSASRRA